MTQILGSDESNSGTITLHEVDVPAMPHELDASSSGDDILPDADAPDVILPNGAASDSTAIPPPPDHIIDQIFGKLKSLIIWLIWKLEACFNNIKTYMETWNMSESPREEFMKMGNNSMQAMYVTSEKAIFTAEGLPVEYLELVVKWWRVIWWKTTFFATQIGRSVVDGFADMRQELGMRNINMCEKMWEKVKVLSFELRKAIIVAWAKFISIWDGHIP